VDLVAAAANALVVAAAGLLIAWLGKGRFDTLDERIDRLEAQIDARFVRLEGQVDARFVHLEGQVDGLRSDLTRVALAVGARPQAGNA
jgi:hypothetical protein